MNRRTYNLGINVQAEGKCSVPERVRYVQIGIADTDGKFTGAIEDYAGGGIFQTYYFIDGVEIIENGEMDFDDMERIIEQKYPGLIAEIYRIKSQYVRYNDSLILVPTVKLREGLRRTPQGYLFSEGKALSPITCSSGMTIFQDSESFEAIFKLSHSKMLKEVCNGNRKDIEA